MTSTTRTPTPVNRHTVTSPTPVPAEHTPDARRTAVDSTVDSPLGRGLGRVLGRGLGRVGRVAGRLLLGRPGPEQPRSWSGPLRDERGSAAIEAVIGVTAFGLFIAMTIGGGRIALARQAVESAANDAARAASIARTSSAASADARAAATSSLSDQDISCTPTSVQIDTSGFNAPIGTTGQVRATVSCTVKLSDLAVPGLPGSRTITESVTSPIDAYRERR